MGRQTQFHMLRGDCRRFLHFVRERDPVIVTPWYACEEYVVDINNAWEANGHYCLWNQSIMPSLKRTRITGNRFGIDSDMPVIEFSHYASSTEPWNDQPALVQGRVWASFQTKDKAFERWYNAIVRWIRKNFIRDRAVGLEGFIGPAAYDWFKKGGLLLPCFRPPITEAWLGWVDVQNQH